MVTFTFKVQCTTTHAELPLQLQGRVRNNDLTFSAMCTRYYAHCPSPDRHRRGMKRGNKWGVVSVRLSRAWPNSRIEKSRKPKTGKMEARHTGSLWSMVPMPWTYLEVKRSKVKVTRPISAVTESVSYLPNGKDLVHRWSTDVPYCGRGYTVFATQLDYRSIWFAVSMERELCEALLGGIHVNLLK